MLALFIMILFFSLIEEAIFECPEEQFYHKINKTCSPCTQCTEGTQEKRTCSTLFDRVCSPCPANSFSLYGEFCQTCTQCEPGSRIVSLCTPGQDTVSTFTLFYLNLIVLIPLIYCSLRSSLKPNPQQFI